MREYRFNLTMCKRPVKKQKIINFLYLFDNILYSLALSGSTKTFWSPATQRHGLVYKREGKKYPIKCSSQKSPSQGSLYLTNKTRTEEDIINRNHKTLNKSTVPQASQDDNIKIVSTSFVDVLNKKLDALYRLTRPYTWIGIVSCLIFSYTYIHTHFFSKDISTLIY